MFKMFKRMLIDDLQFSVKDKRKKQALSKAIRNNPYCFKITADYDRFEAGKIKPKTQSEQTGIAETKKKSEGISCKASSPRMIIASPAKVGPAKAFTSGKHI